MVPQWCQNNPHFIGRSNLLETLRDKLIDEKPRKFNHRVALYGMGGVGKTQVAIEYVVRYKTEYNAVFWITAKDHASLLQGFQDIAGVTKCVDNDAMNAASVARETLTWLEKQSSWLLVLDNVDDISVVYGHLPDTIGEGHLLITTRDPNATGIPAEGLQVEVFDPETATDMFLLRSNMSDNGNATIRLEAVGIVTELGFLALAIEQAAAFIRESLKDIFKFLAIYSASRKKVLAQRPRAHWAYDHVVATTWSLSFDTVKKRNPDAAQLLKLFAFLNPDEILVEFLEDGKAGLPEPLNTLIGDSFEFNKALGDLEQFSLIRRPGDGRTISIHRLVQAVIKDNLVKEDKQKFMKIAVALFGCAFPQFQEDERQICREYQSQVVGPLLTLTELGTEEVANVLLRVGCFLYADGKSDGAERFQGKAVELYTVIFSDDDSRTLTAMGHLAETYRDLGRTIEAADLQQQVLAAREKILGSEDPDTLTSMNNLAGTYAALGRRKEAADLHVKALEAQQRILGNEHPDILASMNNLAQAYNALGRTKEAAGLHEMVLEVCQRVLGSKHPNTLMSMRNVASTYHALHRTKEAVALGEKVLDARQILLGSEHPDTLTSMSDLALTYQALGRTKESAALHEKVL